MPSLEELRHNLPGSPGVFFVLRDPLSQQQLFDLVDVLEARAGETETKVTKESYWNALARRMQGKERWDTLVAPYRRDLDEQRRDLIALNDSLNVVENSASHRSYADYVIDEVKYVIDLFNPANELELPYRDAGEPVVALLLANALKTFTPYPLPVRDKLKDISSFYEIVERFDQLLNPSRICGGNFIARVTMAYEHSDNRLSPSTRPWDLLWTMNVLDADVVRRFDREQLQKTFAKVRDMRTHKRTLLQVMPGFDNIMGREYEVASDLLKMTPVTEIG